MNKGLLKILLVDALLIGLIVYCGINYNPYDITQVGVVMGPIALVIMSAFTIMYVKQMKAYEQSSETIKEDIREATRHSSVAQG